MEKRLQLYTVFHLNLAYSSIGEHERPEVIHRCYWPLLRLAREANLPFGIEASGYTLETAQAIDPTWLEELRRLTTDGPCEFVGSGYAQIIGPLVPAEVNVANLRLGHQVYERLLGVRPPLALVCEQAYSAGMVHHYLEAGCQAIVMEWDNPTRFHPEWSSEWRYLPQRACGQHGEAIPLIWSKSIAFQQLQRYAHGEMELEEYLSYLRRHLAETPRAFPLYANDGEIFDFRPGRYPTEAAIQEDGEWQRLRRLFEALLTDGRFHVIRPSGVLEFMEVPGAGNRLQLESPEQPIPVKKQGKYNITRWAVTGRDDLGINTACWRLYEALKAHGSATEDDWRELCYLWSSDFRTHITERRWDTFLGRLRKLEERLGASVAPRETGVGRTAAPRASVGSATPMPSGVTVSRDGRYLVVETDGAKARLNCRRGLAIDGLWFNGVSDQPLVGTVPHGFYDDIGLGADFYTGHLVVEPPAQLKVTDLSPLEPRVEYHDGEAPWVEMAGAVPTPLGAVLKTVRVFASEPRVELVYHLEWEGVAVSSMRLGFVTLNPSAFERETLFYRTHNGGWEPETFPLAGRAVDHGDAVSFLGSAQGAISLSQGVVEVGDARQVVRVTVDKAQAALVGMITYWEVGETYFCRVALSAGEVDETRQPREGEPWQAVYRVQISATNPGRG